MSKKRKIVLGAGSDCPPLKGHVEIYFLQKERTVREAQAFFDHYDEHDWEITDWKAAAFRWMIKHPPTTDAPDEKVLL